MNHHHEMLKAREEIKRLKEQVNTLREEKRSGKDANLFLTSEESVYKQLFEFSRDAIFQLDRLGHFILVNPAFLKLTGYSEKDLQSKNIFELNLISGDWTPTSQTSGIAQEMTIIRRDHQKRVVSLSIRPIKQDNIVDSYVGIMHDMTDQRVIENIITSFHEAFRSKIGDDFFQTFVTKLAATINVAMAIILEKDGDAESEIFHTRARYSENPEMDVPLDFKLCAVIDQILANDLSYYSCDVARHCPQGKFLVRNRIHSLMGIGLRNSVGQVIGVLCLMHTKPIQYLELGRILLEVFAVRAAAELERQHADAKLKQLAAFPQQSPTLIIEILANSSITYCNPAAEQSAASIGAASCRDLLPNHFRAIVAYCLKTGQEYKIENTINHYRYTWIFHPTGDNRVVHAHGIDITDRFVAEQRYATLVNNVQEGLCIVDLEDNFSFVNKAAADMLGYSMDELTAMNIRQLVSEEMYQKIRKETGKRIEGNSSRYMIQMMRKDGSDCFINISATPYLDDSGQNVIGTLGLFQDITAQVKSDRALNLQRSYFQQLFENSPLAIVLLDEQAQVKNANQAFIELFQFNPDEMYEKRLNTFITPPDLLAESEEIIAQVFEKHVIRRETVRQRKDGRLINVEIVAYLIIYHDQPVGIYCIYNDISQRIQAERQLMVQNNELQIANKIQKDVLNLVSHELRTPLVLMMGNAEMLQQFSSQLTEDQQSKMLDSIIQNAQQQNTLIDDLLTAANLESKKLSVRLEPIRLEFLINQVCRHWQQELKRRDFTLVINIPPELPLVSGDTSRLTQVFNNLLSNAVKFTPDRGRIEISAQTEGDLVMVCICDNGIGFKTEHKEAIFRRFYQVENADNRRFGGVGLGLAIVRDLLELQNASIAVESEVGQGSCFRVFLEKYKLAEMQ